MVHQVVFGEFAGLIIYPGRQVVKEVADDLHVPGAQTVRALGWRQSRKSATSNSSPVNVVRDPS